MGRVLYLKHKKEFSNYNDPLIRGGSIPLIFEIIHFLKIISDIYVLKNILF